MKLHNLSFSSRGGLRVMALCMLLALGQLAYSQPSQSPLLNRDGGGVKPNIMLTMDDSGSMMFQHMPEDWAYVGPYTIQTPIAETNTNRDGGKSVRMDPGDNATLSGFFIGTIAAQRGTGNWRQKFMRAATTNTVYYNPEVRYLPWALAAGGRMANSAVAAAPRDPMNQASGGTINLTDVRNVNVTWCFRDSSTGCSSGEENYDPGLYFVLRKNPDGSYKDPQTAANYTEYSINRETSFPKSTARTDCAGSTCTQAEERRNFANWFTYYRNRNLLARGAVAEAFSTSEDTFRLGWGRINASSSTSIDGVSTEVIRAGVRDFNATTKSNLFTWLGSLPASGGTPLPKAMRLVGEYYKRADRQGPWTDSPGAVNTTADKACRRSYHILVTDGYWNSGTTTVGNSDNTDGSEITGPGRTYQYKAARPYRDSLSDRLADYAMEYWKTDLRPDLSNIVVPSAENPAFWQHMVNFTVGLGVRGKLDPAKDLPALSSGSKNWDAGDKIDDLWHSALNSRGEYLSAKDPVELAQAIRASVGSALVRELREAGVATASTTLQAGNRKYIPQYRTGVWVGDVKAFSLDANGQTGPQQWSAVDKMPAPGSRSIYTWDTGLTTPAAVSFDWSSLSAGNRAALGSVAATHTSNFINFLRGDATMEGTTFRTRSGKLGDFINSNPVLLKGSLNMGYSKLPGAGASTYDAFVAQKAARMATVFVGANDGMLHAFKDTEGAVPAEDGKEIFAFVPRTVYPNLTKLTDPIYGTSSMPHQFYVDGPLREADAYVRAPGASTPSWRNYLLGSLGAGGKAVFALDVTTPAGLGASSIRWELSGDTDPDIGYVNAPIEAGVLPNGQWVAVFGNARFSTSGNAVLYVVNLETGLANKLVLDSAGNNGLGGVVARRDSQGQIVALYAGDQKGNLWKLEYSATASSKFAVAGSTAFFVATAGAMQQPISQPPIVYPHSQGGYQVLFGTGQLLNTADADSTSIQAIYSVWDKTDDATPRPMDRTKLAERTLVKIAATASGSSYFDSTGPDVDWSSQRGWVMNLTGTTGEIPVGLRVIYPPQVMSYELALVSTVAPAQNVVACEAGAGLGINFVLPVETGLRPEYYTIDTNGDGQYNSSDTPAVGYSSTSDGMDSIVKSDVTSKKMDEADGACPPGYQRVSIQNTTGQMMICVKRAPPVPGATSIRDRVWRRIINPPIR